MTKAKWFWWVLLLAAPLLAHVATALPYVFGQYDGEHCMGLLDAVWSGTRFEYYVDALSNGFALYGLARLYVVFFVALACILLAKAVVVRIRECTKQS